MKIKTAIIVILLLLSGCATNNHAQMLYHKKPAFYSYIFGYLRNNHIITEHMADVYTPIASCQKTITALLAYKTLGADYRYATNLYVTKQHKKIRDVIISFAGDPTLKTEDLLRLLKPIKGTRITGKIFLDASAFKTPPHSPNIMLNDLGEEYAQPVSSINLDENLINVTVRPKKIWRLATLSNDLGYPMHSEVLTSNAPSSIKFHIDNNRIQAQGNINSKSAPLTKKISPIDFDYFIFHKITPILKKVAIKGKIVVIHDKRRLPPNLILFNTVRSEPLRNIIPQAIKKSDNLVFDSLYLKIIHTESWAKIKSWNDGDKVIKKLIQQYFSIDMGDSKFVDGSGLSRYNHTQPKKLFALLKKSYGLKEFVNALASPGEPRSTLANRTSLAPNIKAKTGNISGISCLCGYGISNHPTAFVIIANSFASPSSEIFPILDNFVNYFVKN